MPRPTTKTAAPTKKIPAKKQDAKFLNGHGAAASVARTSSGLREALFLEMETLRSGTSDANRAMATAKLAQQIINSVRVEIEFASKFDGGKAHSAPPAIQLSGPTG